MQQFILPLLSKNQETSDVKSFLFDLGQHVLTYQAGQFLKLTLKDIDDPRGLSRFFSIASSPTEKGHIMIATKISESPFKQKLATLPIGTPVHISGPFGKFILHQDEEKLHLLLSGGIGITPFRSILKDATDRKLPHKIVLLYSNQTLQNIIFKDDLDQFAKTNPNLTIVYTITRPTDQSTNNNETMQQCSNGQTWKTGRINDALIKEYVKDISQTIFYICGPPSMVEALSTVVKELGVLEENLKVERFTGYQ